MMNMNGEGGNDDDDVQAQCNSEQHLQYKKWVG